MKVFVAGATGALGMRLIPQLVARGHEVIGMTQTPSKQDLLRALGARPVVADALDAEAVARAAGAQVQRPRLDRMPVVPGQLDVQRDQGSGARSSGRHARTR